MPHRPPINHPFTALSEQHLAGIAEAVRKTTERLAGKPLGFMLIVFEESPPGFIRGHDTMEVSTASNLTTADEEIRLLQDTIKGIADAR
jgi:hypothetical protein